MYRRCPGGSALASDQKRLQCERKFFHTTTIMQSEQLYIHQANAANAAVNGSSRRDASSDQDHEHSHSGIAIPPNKGSRRYSLHEVFSVWSQIESQVLGQQSSPKLAAAYKNTTPQEIYHLELRLAAAAADAVASLSVEDDSSGRKASAPPPNLPAPVADRATVSANGNLVSPDQIHWLYLDPAGNEQGPFAGTVMQEWLTDGYLTFDLRIRRAEEPSFYPLKSLCESLSNFLLPFRVPLPDLSSRSASPHFANAANPANAANAANTGSASSAGSAGSAPSAFAASGSLYSPLLPNGASLGLGAASMRLSSSNHLFDFMGPSSAAATAGTTAPHDYPLVNQLSQFAHPQAPALFGIDPVGVNLSHNLPNLGSHNISQPNLALSTNLGQNLGSSISQTNLSSNLGQGNLPNLGQNFVNGGFGQLNMPSLLQQQIHQQQQPALSRTNSGWGLDSSSALMGANPQTPSAINTNISGLSASSPMSPWATGVQASSRVSSPFVPQSTLASATTAHFPHDPSDHSKPHHGDDPVLDDLHSSMVTGILSDDDQKHSHPPHEQNFSAHPEPPAVPQEPVEIPGSFAPAVPQPQPVPTEPSPLLDTAVPEPAPVPAPKQKSQQRSQKSNQKSQQKPPQQEQSEQTGPQPTSNSQTGQTGQTAPQPTSEPVLAPWAKSTNRAVPEGTKPSMTLKEVQALEAARLNKEKQIKAEIKQEAAFASAVAASKEDAAAAEKPTFKWANSSGGTQSQPAVRKSLAEIQKEEAEAAKSKSSTSRNVTSGSVGSKVSLASSLANSVPKEDSAWTTVASKKSAPRKAAPQSAGTTTTTTVGSSSATNISPSMLRAASASSVNTQSVNSNALKEEFLVWARAAMTNLYPSVSKNDLLEIFTTLPLHTDSAQLIAETIYSSSATMDGRRFAQEFMKKRQGVEKQIGSGDSGSWSSAIITSADKVPSVDDEGWSTSSKLKKRGKKN